MRSLSYLMCSIVAGSLLGGCTPRNEIVRDATSSNSNKETERSSKLVARDQSEKGGFVFRAKYYRTIGPCIEMGDALAMPIIDAFDVVEALNGDFKASNIYVLATTEGGSAYLKEMEVGEIYTLRLTASQRTAQQLRENQKEGHTLRWIDGDEIEEQTAAK